MGSRNPGVEPGIPVVVAVRPESLRLSPEAAGNGGIVTGKVEKAVYLGPVFMYELDVGLKRPLTAVSHDSVDAGFFSPGDRVAVNFSSGASHALVPES